MVGLNADELRFPLLFRQVPAPRVDAAVLLLRGRPLQEGETGWELVDVAADDQQPPAAAAITAVTIDPLTISLRAVVARSPGSLVRLLSELATRLRTGDTARVVVVADEIGVLPRVLVDAGFRPNAASDVLTLEL